MKFSFSIQKKFSSSPQEANPFGAKIVHALQKKDIIEWDRLGEEWDEDQIKGQIPSNRTGTKENHNIYIEALFSCQTNQEEAKIQPDKNGDYLKGTLTHMTAGDQSA